MKNYHMQDFTEMSCRNCDSMDMPYRMGRDAMGSRMGRTDSDCGMQVGMAYVPWQQLHTVYDPEKGLMVGTIFPELDKPFMGRGGKRR